MRPVVDKRFTYVFMASPGRPGESSVAYSGTSGHVPGPRPSQKLLRQVQAGFSLVHHANHALEMAPGPLQAFDNVRVRLMLVIIYHV